VLGGGEDYMGLKSPIGDKIKGGRANRNALIVEATHPTNL